MPCGDRVSTSHIELGQMTHINCRCSFCTSLLDKPTMPALHPRITSASETWYITSDGSRFITIEKANAHQAITDQVERIMETLRPRPQNDANSFANGTGYIQQSYLAVESVRRALWSLTAQVMTYPGSENPMRINPSWVLGMLGDKHGPLWGAWQRLSCISETTCREYGQPYFTRRESEAKGGAL